MRDLTDSIALLESAQVSLARQSKAKTSSAASELLTAPLFIELLTLAKDYNTRDALKGRAADNLLFLSALCDHLINTFSNSPSSIYKSMAGVRNRSVGHVATFTGKHDEISIFNINKHGEITVNILPISRQHYKKIKLSNTNLGSDYRLLAMHVDALTVFRDVIERTILFEQQVKWRDSKIIKPMVRPAPQGLFYMFKSNIRRATPANSLQSWLRQAHFELGVNLSALPMQAPKPKH